MTKLEGMTNDQMSNDRNLAYSSFGLWISFVIRHSCFVIFSALILVLMAQSTHAESPSLIGKWNVEITFANEQHRSVRFDGQPDGKGTFVLTGPDCESVGASKAFGGKVDPRRWKLRHILRPSGIYARQCWGRRGNIDVQGKI